MKQFLELFDNPIQEFKSHLLDDDNERILFSGIYGIGKTTFIKHFFNPENQVAILNDEKFKPFYLTPVNYSISSNEDIFSYIKVDIILELLSDPDLKFDENYTKKDTLPYYINNNIGSLFDLLNSTLPKIEKKTVGFSTKLVEIFKGYSEYHKELNNANENIIQKFALELIHKEGSLYEFNSVSEIITNMMSIFKNTYNKKTILIIDDLDRIDPSHIFRLFNVFASHFDYQSCNDNKFCFDKIIFVCDIDNIRKIYRNIYGSNVDFNGYIDKFYSKNIFHFDIRSSLVGMISNVLRSINYSDRPDTDNFIRGRMIEGEQLIMTIRELIIQGKLNLRSFFKHFEKTVTYTNDDIPVLNSTNKIITFPGILQIRLLLEMFDDAETLINALDYCRKNIERNSRIENPELLCHIIYIIDIHQNKLKTSDNVNTTYTFKDFFSNLIISYQLKNQDAYTYYAHNIKYIPATDQKNEIVGDCKNLLYFQILLIKQLKRIGYIK
jgi:hypothetical protein